jgi:outer membrane biogenesis lipoprotein LolB
LRKLILLLVIAVTIIPLIMFNGCVPSKPTDDIEILPSERLINRLEVNRRRIKNFEGTGTIAIKSAEINNSATFRVVLQKPDSIHLTIMGPFGIELAQAVVTEDDFIFYDALQNTAYMGDVTDDVLRNIFRIDLSFNDLLDAFIGSVNLTNNLYRPPTEYNVIYDEYQLAYKDSLTGGVTRYHVDLRELGIKSYQLIGPDKKEILAGRYSNFKFLEGVAVPYTIEVRNRLQNQLISIEYKNMRANKPNIFVNFKLPEDATIIKW